MCSHDAGYTIGIARACSTSLFCIKMGVRGISHFSAVAFVPGRTTPRKEPSMIYPMTGPGARVRQLRQSKGWTQQQLSEAAGIHRTAVCRIERNQLPLFPGYRDRLSRALDADIQ
jgi:DNA-binding XRE family transcriptional regulator